MNPETRSLRIAIIEDEESQCQLIERMLGAAGHVAICYPSPSRFLRDVTRESFDMMIVDWQLPEMSGVDVISWLREKKQSAVPIIMLTSRSSEADVVEGLSSGADDYMLKPVRAEELVARVMALDRRSTLQSDKTTLVAGRYLIDMDLRTVKLDQQIMALTPKEFDLAAMLFRNAGRLLSRSHVWDMVWGRSSEIDSRTIDTHMYKLRTKLRLGPETGFRLNSVYGHGFRLESTLPVNTGELDASTLR